MKELEQQEKVDIPDFTDEEIEEQVDQAIERFKKKIDLISDG